VSDLSPGDVFRQVAAALPEQCRENLLVVGSLAAGYHFFRDDPERAVRTKDVDCVLEPFHVAADAGQKIANQLINLGWHHRKTGDFCAAGTSETPDEHLPAIRLVPPGTNPESSAQWFVELLSVPRDPTVPGRTFTRVVTEHGHYGLPSFQFLAVTAFEAIHVEEIGIRYARPEMMALANLMAHPRITPDPIKGGVAGREIKRCNKDLGRVLALAKLAADDDYRDWARLWERALKQCYQDQWSRCANDVGKGLRELLDSEADLEEAWHTCDMGLLSGTGVSIGALKAVGNRLVADAVEWLEARGNETGEIR